MNPRYRTAGLFVVIVVLFGISVHAIKAGLAYFPPVLFVASRFDIGAVLLFGYVAVTDTDWRPHTRRDLAGILTSGLLVVALANVLYFVGQQLTLASTAAVIYSLVPIVTATFAFVLLPEERLSRVDVGGIFLGAVGVIIVARPTPATLLDFGIVGPGLVLCGATTLALGSVLVRRIEPTISSVALTGWGMLFGALLTHGTSVVLGQSFADVEWSFWAVATLGYVGVFAAGLVYTLYFTLLKEIGPTRLNLIQYFVPLVAAGVGWGVLGERIPLTTVVGFVVICAGFALLEHQMLVAEVERVWRIISEWVIQ